jgi:hypothetical protein
MNPIQSLQQKLTAKFPHAKLALDEPKNPKGVWSLDVFLRRHHVVVEWKPDKGFAVTSDEAHGYGEGADEVYRDLESTLQRMCTLLRFGRKTVPPEAVWLRELREERGFSQEEIARRLKVGQGAVSKIENRSDLLISSLYAFVRALGGRLIIKVAFPDNHERELRFENTEHETALTGS